MKAEHLTKLVEVYALLEADNAPKIILEPLAEIIRLGSKFFTKNADDILREIAKNNRMEAARIYRHMHPDVYLTDSVRLIDELVKPPSKRKRNEKS